MSTQAKHGLNSGSRVFSSENQREFDELIAEYHRTFSSTNIHEEFLVEEMAQARWRLARFRRLEAGIVEDMITADGSQDADAVLAAALLGNTAGPFKTLQRLAAAAERSYYRALKQLQDVRKPEAQEEVRDEPKFENIPLPTHRNGKPAIKPESPVSSPERFPQGDY